MNAYSQRDTRWRYATFSPANLTIGGYGCFLVSLAMMIDKEPPDVAFNLDADGCFDSQGYLNSYCASQVLGIPYDGKTTDYQTSVCIAETDHYKNSDYPQHFFVWLGDGMIRDPLLDGEPTVNNYNIVSYRLFRPKGVSMPEPCFVDEKFARTFTRDFVDKWFKKIYNIALPEDKLKYWTDWIVNNDMRFDEFVVEQKKTDFSKYWVWKDSVPFTRDSVIKYIDDNLK